MEKINIWQTARFSRVIYQTLAEKKIWNMLQISTLYIIYCIIL